MYDEKDPKKKAMDGIHGFLSNRMVGRLKPPEAQQNTHPDFEMCRAPEGDTGPLGHDGFHSSGKDTGNARREGMEDGGHAHGESPVNDLPDSDPDKEKIELKDDGEGLGEDEKEELARLYDKD